jgi:hypothetical protein
MQGEYGIEIPFAEGNDNEQKADKIQLHKDPQRRPKVPQRNPVHLFVNLLCNSMFPHQDFARHSSVNEATHITSYKLSACHPRPDYLKYTIFDP